MKLSASDWERYISRMAKINSKAAGLMQSYIDTHGINDAEALIQYAFGISTKYGEAAAALACEMYDAVAAAEGVSVLAAIPAETATYGEVAEIIKSFASESPIEISSAVSRIVKRTGADTTLHNAIRDGAEFAWIPSGDSCAFCLMLASGGWKRASKKALNGGHATHIHNHCKCNYAIRFNGSSSVSGYNPDEYQKLFDDAKGKKWSDKVNAVRRDLYSENRDKILEQKRAAYARNKDDSAT